MSLVVGRFTDSARARRLIAPEDKVLAAEDGRLTRLVRNAEDVHLVGRQITFLGYTAAKLVVVGEGYEAALGLLSVRRIEPVRDSLGELAITASGQDTTIRLHWQARDWAGADRIRDGIREARKKLRAAQRAAQPPAQQPAPPQAE